MEYSEVFEEYQGTVVSVQEKGKQVLVMLDEYPHIFELSGRYIQTITQGDRLVMSGDKNKAGVVEVVAYRNCDKEIIEPLEGPDAFSGIMFIVPAFVFGLIAYKDSSVLLAIASFLSLLASVCVIGGAYIKGRSLDHRKECINRVQPAPSQDLKTEQVNA